MVGGGTACDVRVGGWVRRRRKEDGAREEEEDEKEKATREVTSAVNNLSFKTSLRL